MEPIILQVGERQFKTNKDTLTSGSGYFRSLLSKDWQQSQQADGSYFIDEDGDAFEHVLRFLRSYSTIFPLLFDQAKGHDYAMYRRILLQAGRFQIDQLEDYINNASYNSAIDISHSAAMKEDLADVSEVEKSNIKVAYHPVVMKEKVYLCPRRIAVHKGRFDKCGRACENARGDDGLEYEDGEVVRMVQVRSEVTFKLDG
ncbi:MAG: hypothetical protein Q9164_005146 [Protoblastenia rupestris]